MGPQMSSLNGNPLASNLLNPAGGTDDDDDEEEESRSVERRAFISSAEMD